MFAFLIALSVGCRDKIEVPLDDTAVDSGDPACTPADELCDGVDNDCDGLVDGEDDSLIGAPTWYADVDGDGYGDPADPRIACDAPLGTVPDSDDCDDVDPTINPDADEICNDVDDDCDSLVDGQDDSLAGAPIWHADIDGDGFGGEATGEIACDAPLGTVPDADDCDDVDPSIHPDADEICNDVDDDCDGLVDGQDDSLIGAPTWYGDADGDGFGDPGDPRIACNAPPGAVSGSDDCDDVDPSVHPDADEICDDLDDDCDSLVDGQDASLIGAPTWYADVDGDGFGGDATDEVACNAPSGTVADSDDCEDADPAIHPDADEICDAVDDDCDGLVDDADDSVTGAPTWYGDGDGDGEGDPGDPWMACVAPAVTVASGTDCDDADARVYLAAAEVCDDVDNDCDSLVDGQDDSLIGAPTWYGDADGDGFGDPADPRIACNAPPGAVSGSNDCDDVDPSVHPDADEICDDLDDDCDSLVDGQDDSLIGAPTWYADADGDGFGGDAMDEVACSAPSGTVADSDDCDDGDATIHPDAGEICDDIDDDCDGLIDDADDSVLGAPTWYADADGDGYGDPSAALASCGQPSGYVADGTDCDDGDGAIAACSGSCAVTERAPSVNKFDVDPNGNVVVTFDQDVDPVSVTADSVVVYGQVSGFLAGTTVGLGPTVTFAPTMSARAGERLTAVLTGTIFCADGSSSSRAVWSWTAAVEPQGTPTREELVSVPGNVWGIHAWDLDGDGELELVTSDTSGGRTQVLTGHGGSGFVVTQELNGVPGTYDTVGGDYDNDGDIDLAVPSTDADTVTIYTNDGTGTLGSPVIIDVSASPLAIDAADMDADGDIDLVVACWGDSRVEVLENDGSGGFSVAESFETVGSGPHDIQLADIDGDLDLDVLTPMYGGTTVEFLLNGASGTLSEGGAVSVGRDAWGVTAADFTGDGAVDFAWSAASSSRLGLELGDGAGAFTAGVTETVTSPYALCTADLDGDGDLDLAAASHDAQTLRTFLNDGAGTLSANSSDSYGGYYADGVECADIDGDRRIDLVGTGALVNPSEVLVLLGRP